MLAQVAVDNRGLEPPEPMVRILAAVNTLAAEDRVVALMDREPLLLYPELERRGCEWSLEDAGDHYVLQVWRMADT